MYAGIEFYYQCVTMCQYTSDNMNIYCFVTRGNSADSVPTVQAVSEDGVWLASVDYVDDKQARHDIGIDSDRHRIVYDHHYPHGYSLVWTVSDDPRVMEAIGKMLGRLQRSFA